MNVVQSFVVTACAIGIIFSAISSMVDLSKFQKEFRLMFTALFFTVIIKSFMQLDLYFLKDISLDTNPYATQEISTQDYTQEAITSRVENSIKDFLKEYDIQCENISVNINITDDNCISINRVTILVDNFQLAKQLLIENFGDNITVMEW